MLKHCQVGFLQRNLHFGLLAVCVQYSQSKNNSVNYPRVMCAGFRARIMCAWNCARCHQNVPARCFRDAYMRVTEKAVGAVRRSTWRGHARELVHFQRDVARFGALWSKNAWTKGRWDFCWNVDTAQGILRKMHEIQEKWCKLKIGYKSTKCWKVEMNEIFERGEWMIHEIWRWLYEPNWDSK